MANNLSQRQKAILELVDDRGFVATEQLVQRFGVTPQTIRRDINIMCDRQLLKRFHGGAGRRTNIENAPYDDRKHSLAEPKRRIAEAVSKHIPDGSSLFLNIGTTTEFVAHALLDHQNLQVVTNNLNVASILSANNSINIILAGGYLRKRDGGIIGPMATRTIEDFRLDYGVLGVSGIDAGGALLDFDYQETDAAAAIIANSREKILVADHTKFGRPATTRFGQMDQLNYLFLDQIPDDPFASMLQKCNISVKICD